MSKYSVKRPFTVLVGIIMVLVLGYVSFTSLTTDLLPEMSLPYVVVITSYPGASPERVESAVTEPLEGSLGRVSGVVNVSSTSRENVSMVMLEFENETNMDGAMVKLSSQLDLLTLPEEVGKPMLLEISPDLLATMMVTVDYEGKDIYELTEFVEETVVPYIERQEGVASVDVSGAVEQRVEIALNQTKIDKINAKLRAKAEDALADSEKELEDAKKELQDAKDQLEESKDDLKKSKSDLNKAENELEDQRDKLASQQEDTSGELAKASKLMNEALATQKAYETNVTTLKANETALKTEKEQYEKAISEVNSSLAALHDSLGIGIKAATLNEMLGAMDEMTREYMGGLPASVDPTDADAVNALWEQVKAIEGFGESLALVEENLANLPTDLDDAMADDGAKLFALQGMLTQAGQEEAAAQLSYENLLTLKTAQDERIPQIETELGNLKTEIQVAEAALKEVNKAVKEALEKYEEVEAGKISAAAAFGAGQAQIAAGISQVQSGKAQVESGEKQLEDGEKQLEDSEEQLKDAEKSLEDARKTALDNANLNALLKLDTLSQLLTAQNFDMPAGYVEGSDGMDVLLKVGEQFASIEDIENLVLTHIDDIGDIRVIDVADVEMTDNAEDSFARVNGNQALMISVTKGSTAGTATVSDEVNEALAELSEQYDGLHFINLMDQGEYIDLIVDSVTKNLLWGALLAILVLLIFLKDPRPTIVVAFSIPLSVLFAVVLMYFTDITLNIISLSGLALGVGMLVDNSIVVMENIYRMRGLGVPPARAAVKGAKQVGAAIASSTLTTICVFLPIVFTNGLSRQLFTDMGLTIAYSLIASLVVAMTVVPAMSATVLRNTKERPHRWFDAVMVGYEKLLRFCLRFKIVPIAVALGLLIFCAQAVTKMGLILIPDIGGNQMTMTMTSPEDTTKEEAYAFADDFMSTLMGMDGVETVGMMSGSAGIGMLSGGGDGSGTSFSTYLILDDETANDNSVIEKQIDAYFENLDWEYSVSASNMNMSAVLASGMDVEISGRDLDKLVEISEDVMGILEKVGGFENISNAQEEGAPTWRILVDKTAAMQLNLTVAQVFQELSGRLATDKTTTTLIAEDGEYEVHILDHTKDLNMDNLMDMTFTTTKMDDEGKEVKEEHQLKEFAELAEGVSIGSITRENQSRYIHVTASAKEGENVTLLSRKVEDELENYQVPAGYQVHIGGETESVTDAMEDMLKMIALAIVFIYMIMVAQFQSLLSPFIVLFTIPLAFTGGLLALMLTGEQLSMIAMMGFLVLAGVVVNNGIVFVDYANQLRLSGMERREALAETGKRRMRPILMTAMTTILAMCTMALDQSFSGTMGRGMAIVTIGGLVYATLMTLFIVPVLYDLLFKKEVKEIDLGELESLDDMDVL